MIGSVIRRRRATGPSVVRILGTLAAQPNAKCIAISNWRFDGAPSRRACTVYFGKQVAGVDGRGVATPNNTAQVQHGAAEEAGERAREIDGPDANRRTKRETELSLPRFDIAKRS